MNACRALGALGEKAATSEVITALVTAMGDENYSVRSNACALGALGEKAATSEVIAALVTAMGDENDDVRWNACQALGALGEKAATSEVITALVTAMGDEDDDVRWNACQALGALGEKAATSEVIAALVDCGAVRTNFWDFRMAPVMEKVMCGYSGMKDLGSEMIDKLGSSIRDGREFAFDLLPPDRLVKIYYETGNGSWLPLVFYVAMLQGVAMVAVGDTIKIYSSNGIVEVPVGNTLLCENLVEAFGKQKKQLEHDSGTGDGNRKDRASARVVAAGSYSYQ